MSFEHRSERSEPTRDQPSHTQRDTVGEHFQHDFTEFVHMVCKSRVEPVLQYYARVANIVTSSIGVELRATNLCNTGVLETTARLFLSVGSVLALVVIARKAYEVTMYVTKACLFIFSCMFMYTIIALPGGEK